MMPSFESPPNKRKHVTTACVPCRESKIKCDAVMPCANCKTKGRTCHYQRGEDKRRQSLRVAIELLSSRVEQLCQFINENHLSPPPMDKGAEETLNSLGYAPKYNGESRPSALNQNTRKAAQPSPSPAQSTSVGAGHRLGPNASDARDGELSGIQSTQTTQLTRPTNDLSADNILHPTALGHVGIDTPEKANFQPLEWDYVCQPNPSFGMDASDFLDLSEEPGIIPNPNTATLDPTLIPDASCSSVPDMPDMGSSDSEGAEALIDQLSDRVGTLQISPGGQTRYYGPTSNFNLVEMPAADNLTIHRTVRNDGTDCLERLGIAKEVPQKLEMHLTDLYFAWQDPSLHAVDRGMYEQSRVAWTIMQEETPYYSESLRNALCALGAAFEPRHHPSFVTFPRSLADFFADRAKALLEIELDNPTVATVQALVVISGHDIGCKRDARGWLSSGMALRLAFHLALHIDMEPYVARGSLRPEEAELRRMVFWSAFTADHLWGFSLGRPFRTNMDDVTVAKPREDIARGAADFWIPYTSAKSHDETLPLANPETELSKQRILLCEIMAPLGHVLYGSRTIPPHSLQEMNAKTVYELLRWKENLPPELQIDLDSQEKAYLPHVIMLHMQYYQHIIYAHRPWMSKTLIQPQPKQGPGSGHARMMCIDGAASIGKLLQLYESRYTFNRMIVHAVGITCSAASLLIFASTTNYPRLSTDDAARHLSACFRALDCLSASWETAKKARDFLAMLQRKWELKGRSRRTQQKLARKRTRAESGESQSRSSYRSRPSPSQSQQQTHGSEMVRDTMDLGASVDLDWFLAENPFSVHEGG